MISAASRLENPPHLRRNFALGVLNGAWFMFAETLTDPALVITWFLANLSASNFLIGLIVAVRDTGWYLPQLFIAQQVSGQPHKMPLYRTTAIIRLVAWIGITAAVFLLQSPPLLIALFVILYGIYSLASGIAGLPFMEITAKTIPPRQRGRYFGERLFWGGLLSIGGGYLVKLVLEDQLSFGLAFPANVGILMALTTITSGVALWLFIQIIEPPDQATAPAVNLRDHLQQAIQLPRHDQNFRLYLIARVAFIISNIAAPFLAVYATRMLAAGAGMIGIYLGARTAASLASNRLWSWLADHYSGQVVMQISAAQGLAAMAVALILHPLAQALHLPAAWQPWLFTCVFVLLGSSNTAITVSGNSMMLNIAPDGQRGIYVGFANTVLGLAMLVTIFGGLVADLTGYEGVFTLAAVCFIGGGLAATQMRDLT